MTTLHTKRLTIDLSVEEHMKLKLASSIDGVSMKEFLLRSVFKDDGDISETAYLSKGKNKQRLLQAIKSRKGSKTFKSIKDFENAFGI